MALDKVNTRMLTGAEFDRWESTYTTVQSISADWAQTILFNDITAELTISNGNTVSLSALSGGGGTLTNETDPIFNTWAQANSASYTSTYTTVNTNSSNWDYQGTDIKSLTSDWQDTYTTVSTNSSNWDQTLLFNDITAELTISNGNTVSLSALSGGGTLTNETDPIFNTWAQANSASYTSTYTTVNTNSASWSTGGTQTLSFNDSTATLTISDGNTISLSALSGGEVVGGINNIDGGSPSSIYLAPQNLDGGLE